MALETPLLDDRTHQQIVDELRKRIPLYCPEWTDHNLSDPGITLIELFAHMAEMLLYRLNQVPELHYIKFLEMLGIQLQPPTAAQTRVLFRLSEAQPSYVNIPANTEVSTTQSETVRPVIFSTDALFVIQPPQLSILVKSCRGLRNDQWTTFQPQELFAESEGVDLFSSQPNEPQEDDAFYFGFDNDLSHHLLRLVMHFDSKQGIGISSERPPRQWEVWSEGKGRWLAIASEDVQDNTKGMNVDGVVELLLPEMAETTLPLDPPTQRKYWLRVRAIRPTVEQERNGMSRYRRSPQLTQLIEVVSIGGSIPVTNAITISEESLGQSSGAAGQRFRLSLAPVLPLRTEEGLSVDDELWHCVEHFANSNERDRHYLLDHATGEVRFGPAVRQIDGSIRCYGMTPPPGAQLRFKNYRYGGGVQGNVNTGEINRLKTSIPFVASVQNRRAALNGRNVQDLAEAKLTAQRLLRSHQQAVTTQDYENLTLQAFRQRIARVRCLGAEVDGVGEGRVRLVLLPRPALKEFNGKLPELSLNFEESLRLEIQNYLNARRLMTSAQIQVSPARLRWVSVSVDLEVEAGIDLSPIRETVQRRLYEFINPIVGWWDGQGWPFGQPLQPELIGECIKRLPRVGRYVSINLIEISVTNYEEQQSTQTVDSVVLSPFDMFVSNRHEVNVQRRGGLRVN